MTPDEIDTLIRAVPLPLLVVGTNERILAANPAAEALFYRSDMNRSEIIGRHYITMLRQPVLLDCIERGLRTGQVTETTFETRDATSDLTFQVRAEPVSVSVLRGVLVSLVDLSDKQEATQMRRDFVANVSHELRTPLTALLGFIETLRGPAKDDPAAQARFLEVMEREASRMNRLIQDLLSLSKVEAEARVRPTGRVEMVALAATARTRLEALAATREVELRVTCPEAPQEVEGDADQLLQVLTNLMENAIKYGGRLVEVTLSSTPRDPSLRAPGLRLEVRDDGPGIDPLHVPRLTERFYRVDNHRSREMGGTGLGLAIVKHIVNRHRGRLRIESDQAPGPGQGTRFIITLPLD